MSGEAAMSDIRAVVAATLRMVARRGPMSRTPEYLAELAEVIEHPKVELYCPLCREITCLPGCPLRDSRGPSEHPII